MVNFGFGSASILGICLAVAGAALYFLRNLRPELARDHDIFFSAVGLLCGFILLFQGWRLDPILQFGQLLLTGSAIFFAVESIRLRGVATEQAKRNTPIVDDERPVSSRYEYQAELDELEPIYEQRPMRPRIRGTKDVRSTRTSEYEDDAPRISRRDEYEDEGRRRPSNRSSSERAGGQGDRSSRRRSSRPASRTVERAEDEWGSSPQRYDDDWESSNSGVGKSSRRGGNGSSRPEQSDSPSSRPRKRRPQNSVPRQDSSFDATPTDYVDYKPVDQLDDEQDNSVNFDER